ncbi:hypothetical protein JCM10213_000867 [Rhodosporidiobolus nylandii]
MSASSDTDLAGVSATAPRARRRKEAAKQAQLLDVRSESLTVANHTRIYRRILAFVHKIDTSPRWINIVPGADRDWEGDLVLPELSRSKAPERVLHVYNAAILMDAETKNAEVAVQTLPSLARPTEENEEELVSVGRTLFPRSLFFFFALTFTMPAELPGLSDIKSPDRWSYRQCFTTADWDIPLETEWTVINEEGGFPEPVTVYFHLRPEHYMRRAAGHGERPSIVGRLPTYSDVKKEGRAEVNVPHVETLTSHRGDKSVPEPVVHINAYLQGVWRRVRPEKHAYNAVWPAFEHGRRRLGFVLPGEELDPEHATPQYMFVRDLKADDGSRPLKKTPTDYWTFSSRAGFPVRGPRGVLTSLYATLKTTFVLRDSQKGPRVVVTFARHSPYEATVRTREEELKPVAFEFGRRKVRVLKNQPQRRAFD